MTKDQEKYLFGLFQSRYTAILNANVEFVDRPDVIVTLSTGESIGIELTECIYDEQLMMESEYQIKFNKKIIEKLESLIPFKFLLDIDLDIRKPLKQDQIASTIKELVGFCINEFADLQPYERRHFNQLDVDLNEASAEVQQHFKGLGYRKLAWGISRVKMTRYDILDKSCHPESKGGAVPDFTQEQLNSILVKKEKALANYKSCSQQWLVIGEGGDFYSYVNRIKIENGFQTKFDKVFLCRRSRSELIILK